MIVTLIISTISGILGRLGGKEGWNTLYRDIGVSVCICAILGLLGRNLGLFDWLSLILTFGLQWACLTTYRYFLKKPKDYQWWHYALHGFMVSFAAIVFIWTTKHWFWFGARCIVSAVGCGAWYFIGKWNDDLHEFGRYFIITITAPLLLL